MSNPATFAVTGNEEKEPAESATVHGSVQGRSYRLIKRVGFPNWYLDFEFQTKRRTLSTGTTSVGSAHQVAKLKVAAIMKGRWAVLEESKIRQDVTTIGKVISVYKAGIGARAKVGHRSILGYTSALRSLLRDGLAKDAGPMEELRATVLTRELVQRFKEARFPASVAEQERAVTTINSTITQARSIFSKAALELYRDKGLKLPDLAGFLAVRRYKSDRDVSFRPIDGKVLAAMDAAALGLLQPDAKRVRKVTVDGVEVEDARLAPARPDVCLVYLCARYLGMRAGEIAAMRWEWLERWQDGYRMAIIKREYFRPKHTEGRVPVAPEVHALLEQLGDKDGVWILPAPHKTGREDVVYHDANFFARAFLPEREKGLHELRKQAGSEVYTQSKSLSMAAEFLRNQEEVCRKHYAKLLVPPPALTFAPAVNAATA